MKRKLPIWYRTMSKKNCHKMVIEALKKDVSETLEKMADTNRYNQLVLNECEKLLKKELMDTIEDSIHRYFFNILPYDTDNKFFHRDDEIAAEKILANKFYMEGVIVGFNIVNHGGLCDCDKERIESMVLQEAGKHLAEDIRLYPDHYRRLANILTKEITKKEGSEDV